MTGIDWEEKMQEELQKLNYRSDLRRVAKEIHEEGKLGASHDMVTGTVAHWAEQILQEYYGSSDYGYTITTTQHNEKVILSGMYRDPPVLSEGLGLEFRRSIGGETARDGALRQFKNQAADFMESKIIQVAAEAREKVEQHEMNQAMQESDSIA